MKSSKSCNPCSHGKPAKPKANAIFPQEGGKKGKNTVDKSILKHSTNSVLNVPGYGNNKGDNVNKGVLSVNANKISPTMEY
jgi:hypothetical protein